MKAKERDKLKARVEEIQGQINYLAALPFSNTFEEACAERAVACDLEDELSEKQRLLAKFFPPHEEDPEFWAAEMPKIC